jgi:hypothetical protein
MKTITLTCTNCGEEFEKDKNEYKRRIAKIPGNDNFFCSRSCSSIYHNKMAGGNCNPTPPPPQIKNTHNQIYPLFTGWYVGRCAQDDRTGKCLTENRLEFANHIEELWEGQNGKCAFSNYQLVRRDARGKCATGNPFMIASLDRIDNDTGYEIGNVQWTSVALNQARGNLPLDEFKFYYTNFIKDTN